MRQREIDEYLETLWHLAENDESDLGSFRRHMGDAFDEGVLSTLELEGHVTVEADSIRLTREGEEQAREIVRRHRLAEELLTHVLGIELEAAENGACEFEHILASEITESICTLLGHPRQCPHGFAIPMGGCCRTGKKTMHSAVMSLADGEVGGHYKIAYINSVSDSRMHKLMHLGLGPGVKMTLHQRYPSFVVCSESGQLAMERDVAEDIYIWKNGS